MAKWWGDRPTREEAERFLAARRAAIERIRQGGKDTGGHLMAEAFDDALRCERALVPVTTPEERAAVRRYLKERGGRP